MAIAINVRGSVDSVIADLGRVRSEVLTKAIPLALNRRGSMAITQSSRELRANGYNFKASEIKDAMQQIKASAGKAQRMIELTERRPDRDAVHRRP